MAIVAIILAVVSTARYGGDRLGWLFGPVPDPIGVALVATIGWFALGAVTDRGWSGQQPAYAIAIVAATVLAVVAIVVDLTVPFSENMNRSWPESILYYPTVAINRLLIWSSFEVADNGGRWQGFLPK